MQIFTAADGTLYSKTPTATLLTTRTVPSGLTAHGNKPSFCKYRRTTIISGRYERGMVYRDDLDKFFVLGIASPAGAPVLADGGGAGSITGDMIGYVTFVHNDSGNLIAESGPSPASNTLTVTSTGSIAWSSLPATSPDARVTHIRLYRSVSGTAARFVTELPLGTTTYNDTTATLALGAEMETASGVPPFTLYNCIYKARAYYGGDPTYPNRIWYSEPEKPELVDSLNFFVTTSGEAVTGLGTLGDQLMIFTINTTDSLQEYSPGDFNMRQVSPSIGCISHWSVVNIHDRLWFASQAGVYVYDGNFKYVTQDLRTFWKTDYSTNVPQYESCFAADDRPEYCYILSIPKDTYTLRWVAYYLPFEPSVGGGEGQPWWFFDRRTRVDKSLGLLTYGDRRFRLYNGSDDGYLRQEDVDSDSSDDSDTYQKAMTIQTKHYLMDEPGGDVEEGKELVRFWSYTESETSPWRVEIYGGDESAENVAQANVWGEDVAASAKTAGTLSWVAQTVHVHIPSKTVGRGFTWKYTATAPVGLTWRGLGGYFTLGPAARGRTS